MKPISMKLTTSVAAMAIATTAVAGAAVPSTTATASTSAGSASLGAAAVPSAMDACQAGEAPDVTQTVFVSGTSGRGFYPRGVNPDNAIFPGDVVRVEVSGQLRYNLESWTGPEGVGTPDVNGIRPYAATATWDNNPRGVVAGPVAAVDLDSCTAAPAKSGVRLRYGINEKNLADNAGGYIITTHVWRAPGRMVIDRTEVTQGVQDRNGRVALIAGKRTFVRVFVRHEYDGASSMPGVTGTLRIPGSSTLTRPIVNPHITSLVTGGDPRRLGNSLLFEVPASALAQGTRQLVVNVIPPAERGGGWPVPRQVPIELGPTTSLGVIGVRYSYYNVPQALTDQHSDTQPGLDVRSGWWQARSVESWETMRRMAENVLPLAELTIKDDDPDDPWGTRAFDCRAGQRPDGLRYCDGYNDALQWAGRYVDQACPSGGCLLVLLQPESQLTGQESGTCFCPGTARGNSVINLQGERLLAAQGNTLAHEIGHYLGLPHTWDDRSFDYDANARIGDMIGLRYAPAIRLEPQWRLEGGPTYELMSYQRPAWLSVHNYCTAMHNLPGPHPVCYPGWQR